MFSVKLGLLLYVLLLFILSKKSVIHETDQLIQGNNLLSRNIYILNQIRNTTSYDLAVVIFATERDNVAEIAT